MAPIRVMVVDDAADARLLVRLMLSEHDDVTVVAEADGATAALEQLEAAAPDVALLDARMPVTDGFELTAALLARRADLRVAILTSMVDEVVQERAAAAGAVRAVSKGEFPRLADVVRSLAAG